MIVSPSEMPTTAGSTIHPAALAGAAARNRIAATERDRAVSFTAAWHGRKTNETRGSKSDTAGAARAVPAARFGKQAYCVIEVRPGEDSAEAPNKLRELADQIERLKA